MAIVKVSGSNVVTFLSQACHHVCNNLTLYAVGVAVRVERPAEAA